MGGYRQGSGRSKSGYYKGIYCGSTYELCWVIYNLDHNIQFTRFPGKLELNGISYYPDFLLSDGKTIIETKGYENQDSVDRKTKVAESFGYDVTVLRKKDLQKEFDWVKQNYQYKEMFELYDGYKPKYNLICSLCNNEFGRNGKPKTNTVFCNRVCAGRYRKSVINSKPIDKAKAKYKREFTKEVALEVYNRKDKSLQQLAEEYNTTKNAIWFLKTKRTYKWIHD
jgi:hypothetical protein